jgi:hypothetical protein
VTRQTRKPRPVLDFVIAATVIIGFFTVLAIPALTLIVAGVLIASLIAGVKL